MHMKRTILAAAVALAACSHSTSPSAPVTLVAPAQATAVDWYVTVFASQLDILWANGVQTAHYMNAPNGGTVLTPDNEWHYLQRGSTSNAIDFAFDYGGYQLARRVIWRVVWIPKQAEMRLVYAHHVKGADGALVPCTVANPCEQVTLAQVTPTTTAINVSQDVTHDPNAPRVVDVDLTDAFNALIAAGAQTQITWQIRALSQ